MAIGASALALLAAEPPELDAVDPEPWLRDVVLCACGGRGEAAEGALLEPEPELDSPSTLSVLPSVVVADGLCNRVPSCIGLSAAEDVVAGVCRMSGSIGPLSGFLACVCFGALVSSSEALAIPRLADTSVSSLELLLALRRCAE